MQLNPQILRKYTRIMSIYSYTRTLLTRILAHIHKPWTSFSNGYFMEIKLLLSLAYVILKICRQSNYWECCTQSEGISPLQSCIIFVWASVCCVYRYWTVERPRTGGQQRNYAALRRVCRERGTLFEDAEFPPCPRSLYRHKKPSVQPIVWMRPHVSLTVYMSFLT